MLTYLFLTVRAYLNRLLKKFHSAKTLA